MYNKKIALIIFKFLEAACILMLLFLFFLRPKAAFEGVLYGLNICYNRLIPSLFPFFIISGIFMSSSLSNFGGIILLWYTKLLGFKSKKAASGILLSYLGGFAATGSIAVTLYKDGELSKTESELFLCAAASASPAFIISTVGYGILNSSFSGVILYIAVLLANFATGLTMRIFIKTGSSACEIKHTAHKLSVYEIIQNSVSSMTYLCGFVTAFCFLYSVLIPEKAPLIIKYIIGSLFEVTLGCIQAGNFNSFKLYFVCASLGMLGLCAVMQIQSFCKTEISIKPYIFSRIINTAYSILFLSCILYFVPLSINVYAEKAFESRYRLPPDIIIAFFILLTAFFGDFKALPYLRKRKNKV